MSQIEIQSCSDQLKFISCLAMDQYIACGGYDGTVHILQYQSNKSPILNENDAMQLNSKLLQYSTLLSYQAHKVMIMDLDTHHNTVVSAALDGSIYCYQIDTNQIYQLQLSRPIKGIQLFGQASSFISRNVQPQFLYTFEDKIIQNTSTLLNSNKNIVYIQEKEIIENIFVHNKFIITCNNNEIHIYEEKFLILRIAKEMNCVPQIQFHESTVIIGWKNYLAVYHLEPKTVDLVFETNLSFFISGVGRLNTHLIILGYPMSSFKEQDTLGYPKIDKIFDFDSSTSSDPQSTTVRLSNSEFTNSCPVIALLNLVTVTFDQVFALNIPDFKSTRPSEYKFICHNDLFAISSPQMMLLGQPTTIENQINVLLKDEQTEQAMQLLLNNAKISYFNPIWETEDCPNKVPLYTFTANQELAHDIGILLINQYLNNSHFCQAAHLLPSVLYTNEYILYFNQFKSHLLLFASILPINPKLSDVYSLIINDLLINKHYSYLYKLLMYLPLDCYPSDVIITTILQFEISKEDQLVINQCLAHLYKLNKQYDLLACSLLELHDYVGCFQLLSDYPYLVPFLINHNCVGYFELLQDINTLPNSYMHLRDKLILYLNHLPNNHHDMTISNIGYYLLLQECEMDMDKIISKLVDTEYLFYLLYFLFMNNKQQYTETHELLLRDIVKPPHHTKLMHFLRNTTHYSLELAVKLCEQHNYTTECLYLYGRMGNSKGAIKIIIEKLKDYKYAVEYAEDQEDVEIWKILVGYAKEYPILWQYLLVSKCVLEESNDVLMEIPDHAKIPGLKALLMNIMEHHNIEQGLTLGCSEIMINDCLTRQKELIKQGYGSTWISGDSGEYLIFGCGHCYFADDVEKEKGMEKHEKQQSEDSSMRKRGNSVGSMSSTTSTFRKFKKNAQQLRMLMEADKMRQLNEMQVECPICMKSANIKNNGMALE